MLIGPNRCSISAVKFERLVLLCRYRSRRELVFKWYRKCAARDSVSSRDVPVLGSVHICVMASVYDMADLSYSGYPEGPLSSVKVSIILIRRIVLPAALL